jgi:hypothetical protein
VTLNISPTSSVRQAIFEATGKWPAKGKYAMAEAALAAQEATRAAFEAAYADPNGLGPVAVRWGPSGATVRAKWLLTTGRI